MWILVNGAGTVSLEDRENFRMFKLVIDGGPERLDAARVALAGLAEVPGAEHAWFSEAGLRAFVDDAAWQEKFSALIEKARPHGWVHPETGDIRGHIEWGSGSGVGP
jgi:hypothetical protein